MRAVVQRVSRAKVTVEGRVTGEIGPGLLSLLGVSVNDDTAAADYLVDKILGLRIFDDAEGKMNLPLADMGGELLVVSQFTLYGDTRHGRRPSFITAAKGSDAISLYEYFVTKSQQTGTNVATGEFGAMMDVELVNDGPLTIILDTEKTI